MPTYEYECKECNKKQEVLRSIMDPETIPPCPACGHGMTKVYSSFGIQFNGTGFYKTGG